MIIILYSLLFSLLPVAQFLFGYTWWTCEQDDPQSNISHSSNAAHCQTWGEHSTCSKFSSVTLDESRQQTSLSLSQRCLTLSLMCSVLIVLIPCNSTKICNMFYSVGQGCWEKGWSLYCLVDLYSCSTQLYFLHPDFTVGSSFIYTHFSPLQALPPAPYHQCRRQCHLQTSLSVATPVWTYLSICITMESVSPWPQGQFLMLSHWNPSISDFAHLTNLTNPSAAPDFHKE